MTERRYDDEEAAQIFLRAMERSEAGAGSLAVGAEGLSLAQLKQIAGEVGIDAVAVEAVARELDMEAQVRPVPLLGTPVAPQYEVVIDGEITSDAYPELIAAIRQVMGRRGVTDTPFGVLEWRARDANGGRYVSVQSKDGQTRLRVFGNFRDATWTHLSGVGSAGGLAALLTLKSTGLAALLGLGVAPIVAAAAVIPGVLAWRWRYRKEDGDLRTLFSKLDRMVSSMVTTEPPDPKAIAPVAGDDEEGSQRPV